MMFCPKCGAQNPDGAQLCASCSWVLTSTSTHGPTPDAKTSGLAIASLVLGILSFFTCFITAIPAIILGVVGLLKINRSAGQLKGTGLAVAGMALPAVAVPVIALMMAIDAPPIPDDYTVADLRSAGPEYAESYQLLISLADEEGIDPNKAPAIGLSAKDIMMLEETYDILKAGDYSNAVISQTVKAKAESIKQAWQNARKGRSVISALCDYPEITDLTEPSLWAEKGFTQNLKRLMQICNLHIRLQSDMGNEEDAIAELLELDSLLRKLSVNARTMLTKLVCYGGFAYNIRSANFIINNSHTSTELLELLEEHFTRLTDEQVSLRNAFICEYLMFKNVLDEGIYEGLQTEAQKYNLKNSPLFKRNSSLRLYRNDCARWLAASEELNVSERLSFSVWPRFCSFLPEVSFDEDFKGVLAPGFPWYYFCYNPVGSMIISIMQPALEKVVALKTKARIHEDLFEIVLNKRLGRETNLKARAYSDEYIIDIEKKIIFSPGLDGKSFTKDDISLAINPQVLNLTEKL